MTIRELAEELHVTPMTIYRRLQRRGIDVSSLRDGEGGALTQHGVTVIASLFDGETARNTSRTAAKQSRNSDVEQEDGGAYAVLMAKLDAARATIERLERETEGLRAERDRILSMLEASTRALEREQADRASERLALTANASSGILGRFRRFFNGNRDNGAGK